MSPAGDNTTRTEVTYSDVQQNLRIDDERIDHVAEWLEVTLGMKLTAFAVGCTPSDVVQTFVEAKGRRKTASQRGGEPEAASLPRNFAPAKAQVLTRTRRT